MTELSFIHLTRPDIDLLHGQVGYCGNISISKYPCMIGILLESELLIGNIPYTMQSIYSYTFQRFGLYVTFSNVDNPQLARASQTVPM